MRAFRYVGKPMPRLDAREKVAGKAVYAGDIVKAGMLHGRILRSAVPHARIVNVDVSRAAALPGVRAVITGLDFPGVTFGNWRLVPETQDELPLARTEVRYVGDEIAAVAAIDPDTAAEALSLIRVDLEPLPAVFDVAAALAPGAPLVHADNGRPSNVSLERKIETGDLDAAFARAAHVQDDRFELPTVSHAYLEPCACVAEADPEGRITLWTSTQVPYIVQCLLAQALGMRENDVRVIKPAVGGGFGGKMELRSWDACAALLARRTGRPVKFVLSREEELAYGRRRHAMSIRSRVAFAKDGAILGKDFEVHLDGGAYNSMGPTATFLCGNFGAMLYRYPAYRYRGYHVYTNKTPAGAMRGFGAPQALFVTETQMNLAAEALGVDPIEIRLRNSMKTGDEIPGVARITSCGLAECIEKVVDATEYADKRRTLPRGKGIGLACSTFITGGVFNWFNTPHEFSAAEVRAHEDGTVHLLTMAADIGQGCDTVLRQILAEELGISIERVRLTTADTALCPADLGTWGSRVTLMAGNAVIAAAKQIKDELAGVVSARFDLNVIHEVEFADDRIFARARPDRGVTFGEAVAMATRAKRGGPVVGQGGYTPRGKGLVTPTFSFAAQVVELAVDPETGVVQVEQVTTAHDSGTIINPLGVEGQLHGSIHMGLGYALCEELVTREGKTVNATFLDYKLMAAEDMPRVRSFAVEVDDPEGPYGAKEAGEGLVSPTAPAVSEAVRHATGFRCVDLPITPEKILRGQGRLAGE